MSASGFTGLRRIARNVCHSVIARPTIALRITKVSYSKRPFFSFTCAILPTYRVTPAINIMCFAIACCRELTTLFAFAIDTALPVFRVTAPGNATDVTKLTRVAISAATTLFYQRVIARFSITVACTSRAAPAEVAAVLFDRTYNYVYLVTTLIY